MQTKRIGTTIITGFLGAGKTSLLNKIIKKETDYKFAIIENEFSEFGIDAEIINGVENSNIFELSNGCICCTMNTELQETLEELLNSNLNFNHLIIETTGIAEPDSIVQSIVANVCLKEVFYIDSVICLVDSINFKSNIEKPESVKQIAMADIILVNKIEALTPENFNQILGFLKEINPLSKIIPTVHSDYKEKQIIDCQLFNENNFKNSFEIVKAGKPEHLTIETPTKSISIEIDGNFDKEKLMFWMEYFLLLNQAMIYRVKGILSFESNSRKQIFQSVKAAFTIEDGSFWNTEEKRKNRLIFIGKELNEKEITEGLKSLMSN